MASTTPTISLPFLTAYDPPGTSEGNLDPMGLYQIADQLATLLVPAVRERMLRVRFLSAMAVGTLVTEGLDADPRQPDSAPFFVWEWLVVEAMIRSRAEDKVLWGVPGTRVTRNAIRDHGYLDARSYLKTPRIFGFHGVYKRLAHRLDIVDVDLAPGRNAEALAEAWARGRGFRGLRDAQPLIDQWRRALRRGLDERPPRTRPQWNTEQWEELADSFRPDQAKGRERQVLRELLLSGGGARLGALPEIWKLQDRFEDDGYDERRLHELLAKREPSYATLLDAIRRYEEFARALQDGFDLLRAAASRRTGTGFHLPWIASDKEFAAAVRRLESRFVAAHRGLAEVGHGATEAAALLDRRFGAFAEPMEPVAIAMAMCQHHERVQREKSAEGKRPWFDRLGVDRIHLRQAYRIERPERQPKAFVHGYRGWPIRRFHEDLK